MLDVVTPSLLEDLGHLLEGLQSQDFGSDWQARLFQAHMALERDGRYRQAWQQKGILALLPGELLAQAEAAWRCALADTAETQVRGTVGFIINPHLRRCRKLFKATFRGLPDSKNTEVMLHWIGLVESFPNLVTKKNVGFIF